MLSKENKNFSGIYCIVNTITGQLYIGSGICIRKRYERHLLTLKRGIHFNNKLQRSFNKYSEEAFSFLIIEKTDKENLIQREQYYIDTLNPYYNINRIANQMNPEGNIRDKSIVDKISKSLTGKKLSEEHKLKISLGHKGKTSYKKYSGKPIASFSKEGILIEKFPNVRIASEILNADTRHIYRCIKNEKSTHKQLKFKYI